MFTAGPTFFASLGGAPVADLLFAKTQVLINFTGADGSSNFVDEIGHAITQYGSPVISTAEYAPGQIMFTGSEYLRVDHLVPFRTGDFTVEAYFDQRQSIFAEPGFFQISGSVTGLQASYTNAVTSYVAGITGQFTADVDNVQLTSLYVAGMNHICVERSAGVTTIYINGVAGTSTADASDYIGTVLAIGGYYTTSFLTIGPCRAFRVTTGIARYAGNFAPPTLPLLNPLPLNMVLAARFFTNLTDSAARHTLTSVNGAAVSSGALVLDGTNYLKAPASTDFAFGTDDFSISFKSTKSANGPGGYDFVCTTDTSNGSAINGWFLEMSTLRGFAFVDANNIAIQYTGGSFVDGVEHSWEVFRSAGVLYMKKDGVTVSSIPYAADIIADGQFGIGGSDISLAYLFNGRIRDLLITKGSP